MTEDLSIQFTAEEMQRIIDAHHGVAMFPERTGAEAARSFTEQLTGVLGEHLKTARDCGNEDEYLDACMAFRAGAVARFWTVIGRRSRVVSWTISGRGNYPAARMEKRRDSEMNAMRELDAYLERVASKLHRIAHGKQLIRVGDAAAEAATNNELSTARDRLSLWRELNKLGSRDPDGVKYRIDQLAQDEREKIIDYLSYSGGGYGHPIPQFAITNLSAKVKRLESKALAVERVKQLTIDHITIEGATIELDREDNRLRVSHASRPDAEVIAALKHAQFRWSPRNEAWQQPITSMAVFRLEKMAERLAA